MNQCSHPAPLGDFLEIVAIVSQSLAKLPELLDLEIHLLKAVLVKLWKCPVGLEKAHFIRKRGRVKTIRVNKKLEKDEFHLVKK